MVAVQPSVSATLGYLAPVLPPLPGIVCLDEDALTSWGFFFDFRYRAFENPVGLDQPQLVTAWFEAILPILAPASQSRLPWRYFSIHGTPKVS